MRKGFGGALSKVGTMLSGPLGITASLAGAALAAKRFTGAILREGKALDDIGKLSSRIGASTRDLTALEYIADKTGTSFTKLQEGLQAFSKRTGEAAMGTGEAVKAFEQLNLNAAELVEMPLKERLLTVVGALEGVGTEAEQAALAAKIFSDAGKGPLLNMLQLGRENIESMMVAAEELGIVMGDDVVKAIERTNDALGRFSDRTHGVWRQITGDLMPALGAMLEDLEGTGLVDVDKSTGGKLIDISGLTALSPLANIPLSYYRGRGRQMVRSEELNLQTQQMDKQLKGDQPKETTQQKQLRTQERSLQTNQELLRLMRLTGGTYRPIQLQEVQEF